MNKTDLKIETDPKSSQWSNGWVFFNNAEIHKNLLPEKEYNIDWMKGFLAAMVDYDHEPYREYENVYDRIKTTLLDKGISGELLEMCLISVNKIFNGDDCNCLPRPSALFL